jgi:outer membrane receptor for ferrienterochelin and colicin
MKTPITISLILVAVFSSYYSLAQDSTTVVRKILILKPTIWPIRTVPQYYKPHVGGLHGYIFTREELTRLPQRNINSIVNLVAGVDSRAGQTPNIKGARADGTAYYIDGVRVMD